jgi:hypothetical protein
MAGGHNLPAARDDSARERVRTPHLTCVPGRVERIEPTREASSSVPAPVSGTLAVARSLSRASAAVVPIRPGLYCGHRLLCVHDSVDRHLSRQRWIDLKA